MQLTRFFLVSSLLLAAPVMAPGYDSQPPPSNYGAQLPSHSDNYDGGRAPVDTYNGGHAPVDTYRPDPYNGGSLPTHSDPYNGGQAPSDPYSGGQAPYHPDPYSGGQAPYSPEPYDGGYDAPPHRNIFQRFGDKLRSGFHRLGDKLRRGANKIRRAGQRFGQRVHDSWAKLKRAGRSLMFWRDCDLTHFKRYMYLDRCRSEGRRDILAQEMYDGEDEMLAEFSQWRSRYPADYERRRRECDSRYPGSYDSNRGY